jgi:GGDEF domain-containing protein
MVRLDLVRLDLVTGCLGDRLLVMMLTPRRPGIPQLTAALWLAAVALYGFVVYGLTPTHGHRLPVLVAAMLFGLAEVFVVHIDFRRDAHTFSLVEVPLVLGLFFLPPAALVPAHLAGAGTALAAYRRQSPRKLFYNLGALALEDCVAILCYRQIAGNADPLEPRAWTAVFVACVLASIIGIVSVFAAIAVSGGSQRASERWQSLGLGVAATLATTSTTIAMAVLAVHDTAAAWLLSVPIAGLYLAHHSHVTARKERNSLDFLRGSAGVLQDSPDAAGGMLALLEHTRQALNVDVAALAYIPTADPSLLARVVAGPGERQAPLGTVALHPAWDEWRSAALGARRAVFPTDVANRLLDGVTFTDAMPLTHAMIAAVTLERRTLGFLLVANPLSQVHRFTSVDAGVLETLAGQVATALEDGLLDRPLHELRVLERQLDYRARHDQLTGLINRDTFLDEITRALNDAGNPDNRALLVIDLGDPDNVPDRAVLVCGQRLARCLREDDVIARLAPTRLAVLAAVENQAEATALQMQQRVLHRLGSPIVVDRTRLDLDVLVGFAVNRDGEDCTSMLARAVGDLARR